MKYFDDGIELKEYFCIRRTLYEVCSELGTIIIL